MSRPDMVDHGDVFRAVAAAALDGETGTFGTTDALGNGDLLPVQIDDNGELVAASADNCHGVIYTPESRRSNHRVTELEQKTIIGGRAYTVFERAEIAEMETGEDPLLVGDRVFSAAAGAISTSDDTGVYLGTVLPNPVTGGLRLVLRVNPAVGLLPGS